MRQRIGTKPRTERSHLFLHLEVHDLLLNASVDHERPNYSPEQLLQLRLLEDALRDSTRKTEVGIEARAWILSRDARWIFAFERVCEELGLDPSCIREAVERAIEEGRPVLVKKRAPAGTRTRVAA